MASNPSKLASANSFPRYNTHSIYMTMNPFRLGADLKRATSVCRTVLAINKEAKIGQRIVTRNVMGPENEHSLLL